ncbi:tRNA lysidine(34) synthetase TilS [Pseudemcibacter aquimaris]|uniref:tRNA lysidine(34) synthetase TilS n=1 Tax=Pseudemcibacter aquimaris TaxID=2857064 RepID=UPI0020130824|nr:tRNA lysidine(34) synthetase TilS [Pseudemcibacter aquimaris]MCC3862190.1 tRNA lysidine(34) synthetase TilS [Pseudemcibacter aquimaris]WDU58943.1 tRNA lysidine(34) synthetase TilS [Pseudemcibacter aquimaris]
MQLKGGNLSPLTSAEFNELMAGLDIGCSTKIAVAVSGGADSMALALMLGDWCSEHSVHLTTLTVNHGLRTEAAQEAEQVNNWLSAYNINHETLKWQGDKPSANIQNDARDARYRLMAEYCADHKINHLFLAHHKDDQAETFLIRLLRGSGVDGLSAMDKVSPVPQKNVNTELKLCRPFLDVDKSRLLETLKVKGQEWINDPSNENTSFTRVKVRNLLQETDLDGLDSDRLSSTAKRMSRVRDLLDELTEQAESQYLEINELGYARLNSGFHHTLHEEIALRMLSRIFKKIGGNDYGPRYQKLLSLYSDLGNNDFNGRTLAGVVLHKTKEGYFEFVREAANIDHEIKITEAKQILWDGRFMINLCGQIGTVVSFSTDHMDQLSEKHPDLKTELYELFDDYKLRDKLLPTLPVLIDNNGQVILPDLLINKIKLDFSGKFSAVFND